MAIHSFVIQENPSQIKSRSQRFLYFLSEKRTNENGSVFLATPVTVVLQIFLFRVIENTKNNKNKTKHNKTKHSKTKQNIIKHNKTKQNTKIPNQQEHTKLQYIEVFV